MSCRGPAAASQAPCGPYIIPLFPEAFSETLGNNASFHCRALFDAADRAAAAVAWRTPAGRVLADGECADGGARVCVRDHVLTVLYLHAEDAGVYTCEARAGAVRDERAVSLHVRDVRVRLLPLTVTSTFVTLAWNMSSAVTNSYTLRVDELPDEEAADAVDAASGGEANATAHAAAPTPVSRSVTFTVGLKMHSYTVHGLKPRCRYRLNSLFKKDLLCTCRLGLAAPFR